MQRRRPQKQGGGNSQQMTTMLEGATIQHPFNIHSAPFGTTRIPRGWKYVACLLLAFFVGIGNAWAEDFTIVPINGSYLSPGNLVKLTILGDLKISSTQVQTNAKNNSGTITISTIAPGVYLKSATFTDANSGKLSSFTCTSGGTMTSESPFAFTASSNTTTATFSLASNNSGAAKLGSIQIVVTNGTTNHIESLSGFTFSSGTGTFSFTSKVNGTSVTPTVGLTSQTSSSWSASNNNISAPSSNDSKTITITAVSGYHLKYVAFYDSNCRLSVVEKSSTGGTCDGATWTAANNNTKSVTFKNGISTSITITNVYVITEEDSGGGDDPGDDPGDTPANYAVTHSLSNNVVAKSGDAGASAATEGTAYNAVFANSPVGLGYSLPSTIGVTIGGEAATVGTDYTWNSSTGAFQVPAEKVTGAIVVTIAGVAPVKAFRSDFSAFTQVGETNDYYSYLDQTNYVAYAKAGWMKYAGADEQTGSKKLTIDPATDEAISGTSKTYAKIKQEASKYMEFYVTGITAVKFYFYNDGSDTRTVKYKLNGGEETDLVAPATKTCGFGSIALDAESQNTIRIYASNDVYACAMKVTLPDASCGATAPGDISKGTLSAGVLTLNAAGSPVSGDTWYWQTSATGTDQTNSGTSYGVSAAGTYYVRSYNATGTCWSDAKSFTVTAEDLVESFTVVYQDGETTLGSEDVEVGEHPTAAGITTTKEFYTFAAWQLSGVDIALNDVSAANGETVTLTARYTAQYTSGTYEFTGHLTMGTSPQMTINNSSDGQNYNAGRIDNIYVSAQKIGYEASGDYGGWKLKTTDGTLRFMVGNVCGIRVTLGEANPLRIAYTEGGVAKSADIAKSTTSTIYKADANSLVTLTNFTANNKTVTLKKIEILPLYNVTYTDGTGDASGSASNVTEVTLPAPTETVVGSLEFDGWKANQAVTVDDEVVAANTKIEAGKVAVLSANTTFTAQWKAVTTKYAITKGTHEHGDFTIDPTTQEAGGTVTLTATPAEDYVFSAWAVVKTEDGSATGITVDANGQFEMPAYAVTVNATFVADPRAKVLYVTSNSESDTKSDDKLYAALKDIYNVKIVGPASDADQTGYDLVVLHESVGGGDNGATAIAAAKTGNTPVLNTKSYFYGADKDASKRWQWGAPNAGQSVKGATLNSAYCNIANHPLFTDVTVSEGFFEITDDAAAKCMQPVGSFSSGYEGYTLATTPNAESGNGCAIHEIPAGTTARGVSSGKYMMISVSNAKLNALNANGQKLFQNAAAYLIGSSAWEPINALTSPAVTASPSAVYSVGDNIALTASATGSSAATTYTWYKGATWAAAEEAGAIKDAATAAAGGNTYGITGCALGDAGTYWCVISNGTGCEVSASLAITVSDISYDIAFVSAHGTAPSATTGVSYTLPELSASGWEHQGWTASIDVTVDAATVDAGDLIANGKIATFGANVTFTAVWTQVFDVTFNIQSHGAAVAAQHILDGGKVTEPNDPAAIGWVFGGWYKEAACTNEWDFANDVVEEDITLYAKWTADPCGSTERKSLSKVVLTAADDGTVSGYNGDEYAGDAVIGGLNSTQAAEVDDSHEGTETGYKLNNGGSAIVFATLKKGTFQEGDKVVVTITKKQDAYKVEEVGQPILDIYYGTSTDDATFLTTIDNVTSAGSYTYRLTAADVTAIGSKKGIGVFRPSSGRTQNPYIYSVEITGCRNWTVMRTVSFDMKDHGSAIADVPVEDGEKISAPAEPEAEGYLFQGWYKEPTLENEWDFANDVVEADITLYAKWVADPCSDRQSLSKLVLTAANDGTVTGYNSNEYAGEKVIASLSGTADEDIIGDATKERGYKLNSGGNSIVFATLAKGNFQEGDKVTIGITKVNDQRTVDASTAIMTIYAGSDKDHTMEVTTLTGVSAPGFYTYRLTAADATAINTAGYKSIGLFRASSNGENHHVYSVEITGCRDWSVSHNVTFNMHDHGSAIASQSVYEGGKVTKPAVVEPEGWAFDGWYKESTYENEWDFDSDVMGTSDIELHAKWEDETGAIKLFDGEGNLNTTNFVSPAKTTIEIDEVEYPCLAAFGSNRTSLSQAKQADMVMYSATTNATKIKFELYNANGSAKSAYLWLVEEGDDAATAVASVEVPGETRITTAYYTFNGTKNRSFYLTSGSKNDIKVMQVKVMDNGTAIPQFGKAGYSVDFNKGRIAVASNGTVSFEGASIHSNDEYSVLNNESIKPKTYIQFNNAVANTTVKIKKASSNAYYVTNDLDNKGTSYTTDQEIVMSTTGTWYIGSVNSGSVAALSKIEFIAPKCEAPAFNALANSDICSGDAYVALDGTGTVSDGGSISYKWYAEDDAETVLATTATYMPEADGSYYVVALHHVDGYTDNEATSDVVSVTTHAGTAISEPLADQRGNVDDVVALEVVASGKNLQYTWKECATINGEYTAVAGAADAASLNVTITEGMDKYYKVIVSSDCGDAQESVAHVTQYVPVAQANVTGSIAWDWANAASVSEIKLTTTSTPKKNEGFVMANGAATIYNNANFESDKLYLEGEYIVRDGKYFQGQTIKFNTTVAGLVRVKFSHTGNATEDKPARELYINGVATGEIRDNATAAWSGYIEVPAGEVSITAYYVDPVAKPGQQYIRVPEIEFYALDQVRDDSWIAPGELGTVCYPNGHIVVGADMYQMAGVDENHKFAFDQVTVTEPGVPYLFEATGYDPIKFYKTTAAAAEEAGTSNGMVGTFVAMTLSPAEGENLYYFQGTHFYSVAARTKNLSILANRCYVDLNEPHPATAPAPGRRRITFGVNGTNTATGVENIQTTEISIQKVLIDGKMYILRGEKMYDATGRLVK